MIRIAFVINYIIKNGPSSVILNIIHNLSRDEYDISVITLFSGNEPEIVDSLRKKSVKVYACTTLDRKGCVLGKDNEFRNVIQKGNYDIIHTHGFIPDILSSRLNCTAKRINTIHNNMFEDYVQSYGKAKGRIYILMHLVALKRLDLCVCCSKSVYGVMRHYLKNTTYIRNGIEKKKAQHVVERSELGIPRDACVLIYAGGLTYRKNVQFLIHEFVKNHLPDEYLLVLGDGPEKEACQKIADDHVKLLGFQTDPIAYFNVSDIYTSASRSEGLSISALEAMSCGLVLLLSDIPSHREMISMGKSLYIGEDFSIKDSGEDFKVAINKIRENQERINKEGIRQLQQEKLSDRAMTEKYDKIYQRCYRKNGRNGEITE